MNQYDHSGFIRWMNRPLAKAQVTNHTQAICAVELGNDLSVEVDVDGVLWFKIENQYVASMNPAQLRNLEQFLVSIGWRTD